MPHGGNWGIGSWAVGRMECRSLCPLTQHGGTQVLGPPACLCPYHEVTPMAVRLGHTITPSLSPVEPWHPYILEDSVIASLPPRLQVTVLPVAP